MNFMYCNTFSQSAHKAYFANAILGLLNSLLRFLAKNRQNNEVNRPKNSLVKISSAVCNKENKFKFALALS